MRREPLASAIGARPSWRVAMVTCWLLAGIAFGWLCVALVAAWKLVQAVTAIASGHAGEWSMVVVVGTAPLFLVSLVPVLLAPRRVRLARALARGEAGLGQRLRALGGLTLLLNGIAFVGSIGAVIYENRDTKRIAVALALLAALGLVNGVILLRMEAPAGHGDC